MWPFWLVQMLSHHIQKNSPGLLYIPAKYENSMPYGIGAIAKTKCGSGGSGGAGRAGGLASPIYKQMSKFLRIQHTWSIWPQHLPVPPKRWRRHKSFRILKCVEFFFLCVCLSCGTFSDIFDQVLWTVHIENLDFNGPFMCHSVSYKTHDYWKSMTIILH